MPPNGSKARTIRDEHRVSYKIAKAAQSYPRIEDLYEGWKWRLARDPNVGVPLTSKNPGYRVLRTHNFGVATIPNAVILYRYDANTVFVEDIRIFDANNHVIA